MKNPLRKRFLRDLRSEFGKYIVIFIMLAATISFVSGFLVADGSMTIAYNDSFTEYNIEDGHFISENRLNKGTMERLEENGVKIYKNFYTTQTRDDGDTVRTFEMREEVNLACLMKGAFPTASDEIAIDRMYADNNDLSVGDQIVLNDRTLKITGLIALSDYSALFENNNDSMFDAVKFGVAVVTPEAFETMSEENLTYCYSWTYDQTPSDTAEEKEMADDFIDHLSDEVSLKDCVPQYLNQSITFTGEDMGSDKASIMMMLYVVIVILAFVFVVTINDTIEKESSVIGTLRASGYTRGELVRHYMTLPFIISLLAALLGNVLGYSCMRNLVAAMYYGSYSLPTYHTVWNAEAFVLTTVVPMIIMMFINFLTLSVKMNLLPIRFLRKDLARRRRKKAFPLNPKLPFFGRFRTRIIFQNAGSFLILFIGIFFAYILLLFGLGFMSSLRVYEEKISSGMICDYQYILDFPSEIENSDFKLDSMVAMLKYQNDVTIDNEQAEKFSAYTLKYMKADDSSEDILIYGIEDDSAYIDLDVSDGQVYVTSSIADKFGYKTGDVITLKEPYASDTYDFTISGTYEYEGGMGLFMSREKLNDLLGWDKDFFCGYFSNEVLTELPDDCIASVTDLEAVTKLTRQLNVSFGSMMWLMDAFAILLFLVLVYLLSKLIIEKNAQSISMVKILGYSNSEISRLYINSTTIVALFSIAVSLPLSNFVMYYVFKIIMSMMTGYFSWTVTMKEYVIALVLGVAAYAIVAFLEMRKISKVPMDQALKNVE